MARERLVETENIPIDAFCRSERQFHFNIDRLEKKYKNLELKRKSPCVEVEITNGNVYVPVGMPTYEVRKQLDKFHTFEDQFGLGKLAACYNGDDVFGKQYKKREKECHHLDREFAEIFKSEHPSWRPCSARKKSRVERTVIKKTVKELTFENSMDYFNYLVKMNKIPLDIFQQQEKVGFVHRLALPPTELCTDETALEHGIDSRVMRSRSASPCSTESRTIPSLGGLPAMLLNIDCTKSRECSPSRSFSVSDVPIVDSISSHTASTLSEAKSSPKISSDQSFEQARSRIVHQPVMETDRMSSAEKSIFNTKPTSSPSTRTLFSVTPSTTSTDRRSRKRKLTPLHIRNTAEVNRQEAINTPFVSSKASHVENQCSLPISADNSSSKPSPGDGTVPLHSTPVVVSATPDLTPVRPKISTIRTRSSRRTKKTTSSSVSENAERSLNELKMKQCGPPASTPLCSKTDGFSSPSDSSLLPLAKDISNEKSPSSEITPKITRLRSAKRPSDEVQSTDISSESEKSGKETPGNTFEFNSARKETKVRGGGSKPSSSINTSFPENRTTTSRTRNRPTIKKQYPDRKKDERLEKRAVNVRCGTKRQLRPKAACLSKTPNSPVKVGAKKSAPYIVASNAGKIRRNAVKVEKKVSSNVLKKNFNSCKLPHNKCLKKASAKIAKVQKRANNVVSPELDSPTSALLSPLDSGRNTKCRRSQRRSNDSDLERAVTPICDEVTACNLWNEDIQNVVKLYENSTTNCGKIGTILGCDVGEIKKQCDDMGQTALSAVINCARKYQESDGDSHVDNGLKEDRRVMASAKVRNRQLNSGYYV